MKKLPLGIQTFDKIRSDNYLYIDKTKEAFDILNKYTYVFLSRPRRFGKSLFLDTLKNIFEAKKEYFKGLFIEDKWDWEVSYPVIYISFAEGKVKSPEDLKNKWEEILNYNQQRLDIKCEYKSNDRRCFSELIRKANKKYNQRVVILIDEYDKPILDNIENPSIAYELRDILVDFYSVIKGSDEFLKFAFLTGVSKFTKTSIFSGLNNITDISLLPIFGNICGYTQNDIETSFKPYLEDVDMNKLKEWYNGYNFLKDSVYNPFDILQFLENGKMYKNYWFESGTPTFLITLIKEKNYFLPKLSNLVVGEQLLNSFDIDNIDLEVVLYQSGYLTIEQIQTTPFETIEYKLKLPNKEVKISLYDSIIQYFFKNDSHNTKTSLYQILSNSDLNNFKNLLISLFASIPYNNYTKNHLPQYEGFYASVIYVYLQSLGLNIIGEDVTNRGRIDLTIIMDNAIYIIEFKVGEENAMKQLKEKEYHQKYMNENKNIYLIGINFDKKKKNVGLFEWEEVGVL